MTIPIPLSTQLLNSLDYIKVELTFSSIKICNAIIVISDVTSDNGKYPFMQITFKPIFNQNMVGLI